MSDQPSDAALRALVEQMRTIAIVAGQCSVEGPQDTKSVMAAAEAERAERWANIIEAALAPSVPASPPDGHYIPERDGRRCIDHPRGDHELVCLTCMEQSEVPASPPTREGNCPTCKSGARGVHHRVLYPQGEDYCHNVWHHSPVRPAVSHDPEDK